MIAISTAYREALIALNINGVQAYKRLDANCQHSENLLLTLDELLQETGRNLSENDAFAVVIGPGSFTGLRIATALVKGLLAGERGKNILPITTFDLMAYTYIKNFKVVDDFICVINALSGRYFVCKYNSKGKKQDIEKMITKEEYESIKLNKISLQEEGVGNILIEPSPQDLLQLATEKYSLDKLVSAEELSPLYIRKSQAEEGKEENLKKSKI
ncbi:MAG: tRNA (adenosine(37)-N6)-threonylcarbamoyltransferase complex dimerization subunit type 1 TsaB [Clostridiales bacterium]|nr:tRNA (adenosine(37)-N6)-threonylcarbamoyltransferase complex dimerization subunit type 1 TsaB [Clostridiales bacterium]